MCQHGQFGAMDMIRSRATAEERQAMVAIEREELYAPG